MPPTISRIIQALEPSATMAMAAEAKKLKAAGKTVSTWTLTFIVFFACRIKGRSNAFQDFTVL